MMQLEMLLSERTPARPYTSTDPKQHGIWHASRKAALGAPYVQVNPTKLKYWLVFDVDRSGAGLAWEDANLPAPAWAAINKENGHAHLAWGLSVPVSSGDASRGAPLRYLCALEAAYRDKLRADVSYSGVITKNPLHPLWRTLRGTGHLYEMAELAEYVDLERFRLKRGKQLEPVGLGRNCILFDYLRTWAYTAVRRHRASRIYTLWEVECLSKSLERNGLFSAPFSPLHEQECLHVAKSVAKWTWKRDAGALSRFTARQTSKGKKGGQASGRVRFAANEEKRSSARLMRSTGMSIRDIASALGVGKSTVSDWVSGEA
jgi:hypothetical protein